MNLALNTPDSAPPLRRLSGLAAVAVLHVLIVYGLVSGLARQAVEIIKKPLQTQLVEEVKLPPPPPPPPAPKPIKHEIAPPPEAPPPPYVPPPEVTPPAVAAPAIEAVSTPPIAPPPIAPPAAVAQPAPVRTDISVACPQQVPPEMPARALQEGTSGIVKAVVRIKAGKIIDVQIQSGPRVFHNAVRAAMQHYQCVSSGDEEVVATQEFAFKVE